MKTFEAMVVSRCKDGSFARRIDRRAIDDLPAGDVLVRVAYSSLNYKDALSATGHPGVTRCYPHTPGIDAAGVVEQSDSSNFSIGEAVIVTGYDLGMDTDGGFASYIRVPEGWVLPLPDGLSLRESMIYGTAGFTAALALRKLQVSGVVPEDGEVLVTGATGGVGCVAVTLLADAGYRVVAATGKPDARDFLLGIGAATVVDREEVRDVGKRPLLSERWTAVVDSVGGQMLASAVKATRYGGVVACCGLVGGADWDSTVYPFILRGVSLLGVESSKCPMSERRAIWGLLAGDWRVDRMDRLGRQCRFETLDEEIDRILRGEQQGRVLLNVGA